MNTKRLVTPEQDPLANPHRKPAAEGFDQTSVRHSKFLSQGQRRALQDNRVTQDRQNDL
jgi:hypothetical protein